MAWKSKAQRGRAARMILESDPHAMTQEAFDQADRETPDLEALPDRITPKKEPKKSAELFNDTQAGDADPGVLVYLVVFVLLLMATIFMNNWKCHSKAIKMGFPCTYGPIEGCMIETKNGWVPMDKYRYMGD